LTGLVARGIIIFMTSVFKLFSGNPGNSKKNKVESSDLTNQFPKSLDLFNLCFKALHQTPSGAPIQAITKIGPLELNLDFSSRGRGYQIYWMLEPGEEAHKIPKGQIFQFEIKWAGQEPLIMTYDPSADHNGGRFPPVEFLPPIAQLSVKLVNKPSSEQEDQDNRSVAEKLSKRAA
jgi:hypothetical protein